VYYQLAASQYGSAGSTACNSNNGNGVSSACVFYDVTLGDMDVDCAGSANCYSGVLSTSDSSYMPAYPAANGWDFATGIGTINATNLVNNWPPAVPGFSLSASPSSLSVVQGSSVSNTITISAQTGFTGVVTLSASDLPSGVTASFNPATATTQSVLTLSASSAAATGTFAVTITGTSGSSAGDAVISLTVTAQTWTISGTIANGAGARVTLSGAGNAVATGDASGNYSFSSVLNGTYTVTPSKTGYIFSPFSQTVTVNGGNASSVNFSAIAVLPQSGWTLKYVDSQEISCSNTGAALSFDGNPATMWHTQWCTASPGPPHEIQINLGTIYNLTGFAYLPRQDSSDNGKIKQYEFYVSNDAASWALVSSGVLITTPGDKSQKVVMFNATQGQYVRLREITEVNNGPWASMAELNVLGTNLPPDFLMSANPAAVSAPAGGSATTTITTAAIGGFNNAIGLSASGQPAGVTVTFNPSTLASAGSTSVMNIAASTGASVGTYPVTVTASGGGMTHSTTVTLTVLPPFIPQIGWTLKYVDSQEISCSNTGAAMSFDGNPATMWHTQWCTAAPGPPHEIQINLGTVHNLTGFAYLPRQDSSDNGKIKQYEFYVSNDGTNWSLISSGVLMTTPGDKSQKVVMFNAVQGQYVRLREITEINNGPWASMAELNILGGNLPPDFVMSANPGTVSVSAGSSANTTISTTAVGGFNNAIGLSASGQPAGVTVTFNPSTLPSAGSTSVMNIAASSSAVLGTFPVTVTASGGGITHSATVTLTVLPPFLSQIGWTLKYVDSQEISCSNTGAVLSFDGNPATMWHTQWCAASPGPPHEIQVNLGATHNLTGFAYLPRQDSSDNGKIKQYELYVSSDGSTWTLVSSGVLMTTPGDKSQKVVMFNAAQGQYVRLREITEINGNPWGSMAELNLFSQ
jgi:hypothetical protein